MDKNDHGTNDLIARLINMLNRGYGLRMCFEDELVKRRLAKLGILAKMDEMRSKAGDGRAMILQVDDEGPDVLAVLFVYFGLAGDDGYALMQIPVDQLAKRQIADAWCRIADWLGFDITKSMREFPVRGQN